MPKQAKITATLIVYNEQDKIKKCLDAIKNVVDEIIVVHDGPCTDKTLEIVKKYTKKIFVRPHWGEASPHKPFTLQKATGDWILTVDADEILSLAAQKQLRNLVKDADKNDINAYGLHWPFYDKNRRITKGSLAKNHKVVLMRKSKTTCSGIIHDWYKVKGKTKMLSLELDHQQPGDNWSMRTFFKKNAPRTLVDARYRVQKGYAPHNLLAYLAKAPVWFVLYFAYYFILKKLFLYRGLGLRLSLQFALYNYLLFYHIFTVKLNRIFK